MKNFLHKLLIPIFILSITYLGHAENPPLIEWQKTYGTGFSSQDADAFSIIQTNDDGFILAGRVYSITRDWDFWIIKINNTGIVSWQKTLGGTYEESPKEIIQTSDSGYIIAGITYSNDLDVSGYHGSVGVYGDGWIVKLDKSGNVQWKKCIGGTSFESANSIQQTNDGGFIVAGYSSSNDGDLTGISGSGRYWIIKLSANGDIDWQKLYGYQVEIAYSIRQTFDNGFIIAGFSRAFGTQNSDAWIIKLDSIGNLEWEKVCGGSSNDGASCIRQTCDSGYIFVGFSESNDGDVTSNYGNHDYWVVKLDKNGTMKWQKNYGGSDYDYAYSIDETIDNGYVIAGRSYSHDSDVTMHHALGDDYWVINIDSLGTLLWEKALGGTAWDIATSVIQSNDGGFVVAGRTWSTDGDLAGNFTSVSQIWVVKLGAIVTRNSVYKNIEDLISIYPNPNNGNFTVDFTFKGKYPITIRLFDISGKIVYQQNVQHNNQSYIQISDALLSSGLYNIQISSANDTWNKKVLIKK